MLWNLWLFLDSSAPISPIVKEKGGGEATKAKDIRFASTNNHTYSIIYFWVVTLTMADFCLASITELTAEGCGNLDIFSIFKTMVKKYDGRPWLFGLFFDRELVNEGLLWLVKNLIIVNSGSFIKWKLLRWPWVVLGCPKGGQKASRGYE